MTWSLGSPSLVVSVSNRANRVATFGSAAGAAHGSGAAAAVAGGASAGGPSAAADGPRPRPATTRGHREQGDDRQDEA